MSEIEFFVLTMIIVLAILALFGVDIMFLLGASCILLALSVIDLIKNERRRVK